MTRHLIYLATDAIMRGDPPQAGYHAHTAPDDPTLWLVAVSDWHSVQEQDRWEALPGVTCLFQEDHGKPAPPSALAAFASWGARPGHTRRDFLHAVRKVWPEPRV